MPTQRKKRVGAMLVDEGLIREDHLIQALNRQKKEGGKFIQNLIALECVKAEDVTDFLARRHHHPHIEIGQFGVPEEVLSLVPRDFAIRHEVFPLDHAGSTLTLGMVCPLDTATIDELEAHSGLHVMPVLCSGADLKASIERCYGTEPANGQELATLEPEAIGSTLRLGGIPTVIKQLSALPALPVTVRKVREAIDDPEVSTHDVGTIIATDPTLAAKVLSIANSPAFGFPNQVTSIHLAVSLLGMEETYSVVLSASVVDLMTGSKAFDYRTFWVRSMLCGTLCKIVAQRAGFGTKPGIFTAGLLLDIGRLALTEVAPQRYATIDRSLRGSDLVEAEEQVLGIGHPEAGYLLASAWDLPDELGETIRLHHMPEYATLNREAAAIAAIGNTMAYLAPEEYEDPSALSVPCARYLTDLQIADEAIIEMFDEMKRILKSEFLLQRRWDGDARQTAGKDAS
ncbi:MAG: hypothetical protein AMXMBFR82_13050 [Candidatus Hydrogenedentota bacterium]